MATIFKMSTEERASALAEAKARGVPPGWTVELDKRKRRKWIAPNGRTCDSIPKALTMSVEMGLLPPDTVIHHPPPKRRGRPPKNKPGPGRPKKPRIALDLTKNPSAPSKDYLEEEEDDEEEDDDDEPMEPPYDPETTLDYKATHLTTVHWDPSGIPGRKVGCRVRIADDKSSDWKEGRITRYDPCTHKHKVQFKNATRSVDKVDADNSAWIHLRMEDGVQVATRLVWAHVKGYAWWPAMVMVSDVQKTREGSVNVEFFGSLEVATLRDGPECLRPFDHGKVDDYISKNKKKRNASAVALALEEEKEIQRVRNEAAIFYARKAWYMANAQAYNWLGKKVQVFRSDVNYPYGDTVTGRVRQFSPSQKKWLVSFDMSQTTRKKYGAAWINLQHKEHKVRVLEKAPKLPSDEDIAPFVFGYQTVDTEEASIADDASLPKIVAQRCKGCVDYWRKGDDRITCTTCQGVYHLDCLDPAMTPEAFKRLDRDTFVCNKCVLCRGCYQRDVCFGCQPQPIPSTLSFPEGESLDLCSMCVKSYEKRQYCPNCAHSWDDDHFQQVQRQIRWQQMHRPKKRGRKRKYEDPNAPADYPSFTAPVHVPNEEPYPEVAKVNPVWYYPETSQWGYTEVDMLTCDSCKLWVHAGCAGVDEDEYEVVSNGEHHIYSKEFLCRMCCRNRCVEIIQKLQKEDSTFIFAQPVTDKMAHNYHDVIKHPMDLQTMLVRAEREEYRNYAWVRELFELMVLNALTFNRYHTAFWNEARRFYKSSLQSVWKTLGKAAPPSKYDEAIQQNFEKASHVKKMEEDRVQEDKTVERKDLVAGAKVSTITLPELRQQQPDQVSCVPCTPVKLKSSDAYYCTWMDSCFVCGSSGASDTLLFCVDCGEAFHSFCVSAPIHSMDAAAVASWRCPNCKICEISGDTLQDELKMLFCEMCDRGFSLDLLDPPLTSAPSGLWICGQCVNCTKCRNKLEPNGPSLKHWSRDPNLCFRCGGCDGLVDDQSRSKKCSVCSGLWRDDDTDLAQCADCDHKVHSRCDPKAFAFLKKAERTKKYYCPTCSKKRGIKRHNADITRGHMYQDVCTVVDQGVLQPGENCSQIELQEKLMEQVDWKTRNLWRDEYRKVVLEGVRFLQMAKEQFGDSRYLMDRFWEENVDLPPWMGQRATRFIHMAKKLKLETLGFSARRIEFCVLISKLAASWLKVACRTMGLKAKKNIKGFDRVNKLLTAPHDCGAVELTYDQIRCERNRNIINKDEWLERYEPMLKGTIQSVVFGVENAAQSAIEQMEVTTSTDNASKLTKPLCGWNGVVDDDNADMKWEDKRECCLCHMCGDDDAGLADDGPMKPVDGENLSVPHTGRLLPMGEGLWVHASCALWSSETWEAESGGKVNAMEKARSRGSQLRCFGCGRHGATVGCTKLNCNFNYHFACAYACGAVFTPAKHVYCQEHKDCAEEIVKAPSIELMKTLVIAPEKVKPVQDKENGDTEDSCSARVGALIVHSFGEIEQEVDGFHSENFIMPPGYIATRIFWSTVAPRTRTVYVLRIEKGSSGKPVFSITPGDSPLTKIRSSSASSAYNSLLEKVKKVNDSSFSQGDLFSRLPTKRNSRKKTFGLNGPQFFGFGLDPIRKALEQSNGIEAVVAPISESSPQYKFCFFQPSEESIIELQRIRAAAAAEKKLENTSGCARTEGMTAVARSGGSDRITRALVRNVESDNGGGATPGKKVDTEKAQADRKRTQVHYREMKAVPIERRLVAKRSHIHGWGLFAKLDFPKDSMIVEYMGEVVRRAVADVREKQYEISGEGSCYMFRLDLQRIVDATKIGCMARFMNHSCEPNAYAKVITVETEFGQDKKIMVFALRDIKKGEEITYDYKFQVEDGSLKCTCGASKCIGRLN
eukprot:Nitzschia sp. Nitz4//scaffold57_size113557//55705//61502//NITZ4_003994-RA/size113557-augustus-gene-0.180-mRNA-1//-1//CDS//3329554855//6257//frame0